MIDFLKDWSYWGVVLCVLGTGVGFPIPEDLILLWSGWLCAAKDLSVVLMIVLVYISILVGDAVIYGVGRRFGHHVPKVPLLRSLFTEKKLAMAEAAFHKYGSLTVFITRLTPLIRAPIYFTAGAFKFHFGKFLFYDGLAAMIGTPIVILLGYYFADRIEEIEQWSESAKYVLWVVVAIAAVAFLFWQRRRKAALLREAEKLDAQHKLHHHVHAEAAANEGLAPEDEKPPM